MSAPESTEARLFESALECRTPAERAAFLDQACADQPDLRRRVEALLAAHDASGEFLEARAVAARPTIRLDLAPEEKPGTVIGHYKLLQRLGEGGCGVVYMAEQDQPVRRRVALKVIKLGMDTRSVVARFEAERQALAMMDHSNIAKVLDAGTTEKGRPFFVMELVRGIKITDYCDQNHLNTEARLELFIKVCQAVQHAHQKGIIHRDIKPSNILVTLHDGVPVPKVIDFGIAKAIEQKLTEKTLFTALNQFLGTPAYMSPEQAEMSGLDIDTRSDIYSLGVLLYELLTGRTPFDAQELIKEGLDAIRRTIREVEPARPSTRLSTMLEGELTATAQRRATEVSRLMRLLKGDLDWIVMKCLEKDRTRRYETANGLAADLGRHLKNEPVVARPPSGVYRLRKLIARHRVAAAAVAAVMTALLLGAIGTGIGWARTKKALTRAETAEKQAVIDRNTAVDAKGKAEEASRRLADANETLNQKAIELRRALYTSTMGYVQSAIKANDIGRAHELLTAAAPEERGWEWSLMHWFTDRSRDTRQIEPPGPRWDEHGWITFRSSFSPDGTRAATAHPDGTVTIWDVSLGKPLRSFQAYPKDSGEEYYWGGIGKRRDPPIEYINWVLKGRRLLTVSAGLLPARLWNPETGNAVMELEGPSQRLQSLHSIADGSRLLAVPVVENGHRIKEPSIWDMQSGKILCTLRQPATNPAISLAVISPNGRWAAGGNFPNAIVWDASTGQVVTEPKLKDGDSVLAISSDGRLLATTRRLIDVQTGEEVRRFEPQSVHSCYFSPDGRLLAVHQSEHTVSIVEVHSQQEPRLILSPSVIEWLRFSEDSKTLITTGHGIRRVWDLSPDPCFAIRNIPGGVLGFSSDGRQLAIRECSDTLYYSYQIQGNNMYQYWPARLSAKVVWLDAQTGQRLRSVDCGTTVLDGPHYDGKRIVVLEKEAGEGNLERFCRVRVIDPEVGGEVGSIRGLPGLGKAVAISPDGKRVAVARWWFDGFPFPTAMNVIDVETGAIGPGLQGLEAPPKKLAFSPNGQYLTAGSESECALYDTQSGRRIAVVKGYQTVSCFSPDSARVLIGGYSTGLRVFESATGRELARLRGQHDGAAFSPDGRRLVSTVRMPGGSQSLTVWDAQNYNELASVPLGASEVYFSPDGHRVAAASWGDSVLMLDGYEPAGDVKAARQALRISQTAAELVKELRMDRDGTLRTNDEWRKKIEADKNLEPEVRAAALLALRAPDPEAAEKLSRFVPAFRSAPQGKPDAALVAPLLPLAQELAAQAPESSTILGYLGEMQYWNGQYEAVEETLKRAEELHRKEHAQPDPWNLLFSALTQFKLGKAAEAKQRLAEALAQPTGSDWNVRLSENPLLLHAEQAITGLDLAGYAEAASTNDARKLVQLGLTLAAKREAEFGKAHPATVRSLAALASSYSDLGQFDQAAKAFATAYEAASLGTNAAVRTERLRELLDFLQKHARSEDAVQLAMLVAELRERAAYDNAAREDLHLIVEARANVLKRLERRGEEEACRRDVLQLCEQIHGATGEHTMGALDQLARLLRQQGDSAGAEALLVAHLGKLGDADESTLLQKERLLGWLVGETNSIHPDAPAWPGRLTDTSRKLCEAQISRCTGQLKTTPLDPEALASRAFAYTRLGQFKEAVSDYDLKIRLDSRNHWHWYYQGCLLAMLGNEAAYRQHCRAMLERYGDTLEGGEANRVVKTALLLPLPPEETKPCLELLNRTFNEDDAWDQLNKGIAEIRCGRYSAASEWLTRCRDRSQNDNRTVAARRAAAQFYLAIAYHHLGQAAQATKEMSEAMQLVDTKLPKAGRDDLNAVGTENWLVCQIARREATSLRGSGEQVKSAEGR